MKRSSSSPESWVRSKYRNVEGRQSRDELDEDDYTPYIPLKERRKRDVSKFNMK